MLARETEITLRALRTCNVNRQQEWDPTQKITPEYSAIEFAGEVGELLNVVKKRLRERIGLRGSLASMADLEQEFGDCLITLDLLAMRMGVDMTTALRRTFNDKSVELNLKTRI